MGAVRPNIPHGVTAYVLAPNGTGYAAYAQLSGLVDLFHTSDFGALLTTAIAAAQANNKPLSFAVSPGSYAVQSVAAIPRRSPFALVGAGTALTTFVPDGAGGRRLLDMNLISDNDVFNDIEVGGFGVDCTAFATADITNHKGQNHIVIGNLIDDVWQQRINIKRVYCHDLLITNVPTNTGVDTSLTHFRNGIALGTRQLAASEGTQNYVTDVICERIHQEGGNGGILVFGVTQGGTPAGLGTNILLDNITFRDSYHTTGTLMTTVNSCANFMVGYTGMGGSVTIDNCVGVGSSDSGIEIDNFTDVVIKNCKIVDCANNGILGVNFNTPYGGTAGQVWTMRDCQTERLNVTPVGPGGLRLSSPFGIPHGKWAIENCWHRKVCSGLNVPSSNDVAISVGTPDIREIVINGFHMDFQNMTIGAGGMGLVGINLSNMKSTTGRGTHITMRDIEMVIAGSNAGSTTVKVVSVDGANGATVTLDVDGVTVDENITSLSNSGLRIFELGRFNGPSTMSWSIGGVRVVRATNAVSTPQVFKLGGTGSVTIGRGVIRDFDLGSSSNSTIELVFDGPSNVANIEVLGGKWRTRPTVSSPADPGTNVAYQNILGYPVMVYLDGGSITTISHSPDNSVFTQIAGARTNASIRLDVGQAVKLVHAGAPTWKVVPILT